MVLPFALFSRGRERIQNTHAMVREEQAIPFNWMWLMISLHRCCCRATLEASAKHSFHSYLSFSHIKFNIHFSFLQPHRASWNSIETSFFFSKKEKITILVAKVTHHTQSCHRPIDVWNRFQFRIKLITHFLKLSPKNKCHGGNRC